MRVLDQCGCGDPRFPLPSDDKRYCSATSVTDRQCLSNLISSSGGYHHLQLECDCCQPCTEKVFETSYSAAAWPSMNFKIGASCPADIFNDTGACTEYYRVNTAYVEIYYLQLNFETLRETAGYTMVNLFSDFGGNLGLWIGFSVITVCEIIELIFEIGYYLLCIKPIRYTKSGPIAANEVAKRLKIRPSCKQAGAFLINYATEESGLPIDPTKGPTSPTVLPPSGKCSP
ncbi:unnamed protein product [Cylicocyclus nassatus]|uniref:Uncharacterized protein n=1 Tax=Cylicocyclus nassatus TaxID=53992 RepID=A0AA36M7X1_CYLNA|nr:unnamed protein product [Cylicocyclus nassatus]